MPTSARGMGVSREVPWPCAASPPREGEGSWAKGGADMGSGSRAVTCSRSCVPWDEPPSLSEPLILCYQKGVTQSLWSSRDTASAGWAGVGAGQVSVVRPLPP